MSERVDKKFVNKEVLKRLSKIPVTVLITVVATYFVLVISIFRVVPSTAGTELVPIKDITTKGGILPSDTQVLVNRAERADLTVLGKIKSAFIPRGDLAVVKIIAGPYGEMKWNPPHNMSLIVNKFKKEEGQKVSRHKETIVIETPFLPLGEEKRSPTYYGKYLENQYLCTCISGACTPGAGLIIHRDGVLGELVFKREIPTIEIAEG